MHFPERFLSSNPNKYEFGWGKERVRRALGGGRLSEDGANVKRMAAAECVTCLVAGAVFTCPKIRIGCPSRDQS